MKAKAQTKVNVERQENSRHAGRLFIAMCTGTSLKANEMLQDSTRTYTRVTNIGLCLTCESTKVGIYGSAKGKVTSPAYFRTRLLPGRHA